jgi:hypothetical protein
VDREEKRLLARLKERAIRKGYRISKSSQPLNLNNKGQYRLIDWDHNTVILGERFDASLEAIEEFLKEQR